MKLITAGASPYARKVGVVLHETGQDDAVEKVIVATAPGNTAPELQAANPMGRLPALIRDDAPALFDSPVICRFLNANAGGALYPEHDWDALVLEALGDGMMDSAISMVYERRLRPEDKQSDDWIEAQWAKVSGALDALEAMWIAKLKAPLTIGQIAVACGLGYLDFRLDARAWRTGRPELAAWYEAFAPRPSMQATAPAG